MSKLARTLESASLLERTRDPRDPRAVRLALTERGADVTRQAIGVVQGLLRQPLEPLGGLDGSRARAFVDDLTTLLDTPLAPSPDPAGENETEQSRPPPHPPSAAVSSAWPLRRSRGTRKRAGPPRPLPSSSPSPCGTSPWPAVRSTAPGWSATSSAHSRSPRRTPTVWSTNRSPRACRPRTRRPRSGSRTPDGRCRRGPPPRRGRSPPGSTRTSPRRTSPSPGGYSPWSPSGPTPN